MVLRGLSLFVASSSWLFNCVSASVTVYGAPSAQATPCIGAVPCDGGSFNAVLPNDTSVVNFQTSIPVQLYSGGMDGLSKSISGDYFGFSLELSVSNHLRTCCGFWITNSMVLTTWHVVGTDGNLINPVFLNLLSTVISRSQDLMVRIGGNSQEQSVLVSGGLSDGNMIEKGQTRDSRVRHLAFFKLNTCGSFLLSRLVLQNFWSLLLLYTPWRTYQVCYQQLNGSLVYHLMIPKIRERRSQNLHSRCLVTSLSACNLGMNRICTIKICFVTLITIRTNTSRNGDRF